MDVRKSSSSEWIDAFYHLNVGLSKVFVIEDVIAVCCLRIEVDL